MLIFCVRTYGGKVEDIELDRNDTESGEASKTTYMFYVPAKVIFKVCNAIRCSSNDIKEIDIIGSDEENIGLNLTDFSYVDTFRIEKDVGIKYIDLVTKTRLKVIGLAKLSNFEHGRFNIYTEIEDVDEVIRDRDVEIRLITPHRGF